MCLQADGSVRALAEAFVNRVVKCVVAPSMFLTLSLLPLAQNKSQSPKNDAEENRTALILLENAWNQAQLTRDGKALTTLVADSYIYTDYDGTVMNRAQFLADTEDPSYHLTAVANSDVAIFLYDNAAVVIGAYRTKGVYRGHRFDHSGRFTDTWLLHNNRWQCVATHTSLMQK
jgi:Domain of unknown function (DUF4440)